jgi:hypothetical protein
MSDDLFTLGILVEYATALVFHSLALKRAQISINLHVFLTGNLFLLLLLLCLPMRRVLI